MHKSVLTNLLTALLMLGFSGMAMAQSTTIPFGDVEHDASQPVEIASDSFRISQKDRTAEFIGNVLVGQGQVQLFAEKVVVEYSEATEQSQRQIERLLASGGVTLVNGDEAAEGQSAVYSIESGQIVMEGDVILTQGENALSGQKLTINLTDNTAIMSGRVKTIFKSGSSN